MSTTVNQIRDRLAALESQAGQRRTLAQFMGDKLKDARLALDRGDRREASDHLATAKKLAKIQRSFSGTDKSEDATGH